MNRHPDRVFLDMAGQRSGLVDVVERLDGVDGVKVCRLGNKDIVRHDMVQRIIDAYEATDPKRE